MKRMLLIATFSVFMFQGVKAENSSVMRMPPPSKEALSSKNVICVPTGGDIRKSLKWMRKLLLLRGVTSYKEKEFWYEKDTKTGKERDCLYYEKN